LLQEEVKDMKHIYDMPGTEAHREWNRHSITNELGRKETS